MTADAEMIIYTDGTFKVVCTYLFKQENSVLWIINFISNEKDQIA